jgi:hypothetical protein
MTGGAIVDDRLGVALLVCVVGILFKMIWDLAKRRNTRNHGREAGNIEARVAALEREVNDVLRPRLHDIANDVTILLGRTHHLRRDSAP